MEKFERPALCRLCRFPAGDARVRMSDLDLFKLSRWWREALQTDLEEERLSTKFICQFCVWDARYQGEHEGWEDCDWWSMSRTDNKYYENHYHTDPVIRPCKVMITSLKIQPDVGRTKSSSHGIPTECIICGETFGTRRGAFAHVLKSHKDIETLSCRLCCLHFKSKLDKETHKKNVHPCELVTCHFCYKKINTSRISTVYNHLSKIHHLSEASKHGKQSSTLECCGKSFHNFEQVLKHMKINRVNANLECIYCKKSMSRYSLCTHVYKYHKSVAVKCLDRKCGKFFFSIDEREHHIKEVHESKCSELCMYCKRKIPKKGLNHHINHMHYGEAIKCDYNHICNTFFHTEEEKSEHISKVHLGTKVVPRSRCIKCSETCCNKYVLFKHFRTIHKLQTVPCKHRGCNEYFFSESDYQNHLNECHLENEKNQSMCCKKCNYVAYSAYSLRRHLNCMHETLSLKCRKCPKILNSRMQLIEHIRNVHSHKKMCNHCETRVFKLSEHLRVIPCKHCGAIAACSRLKTLHEKSCKRMASS